MDHNFIYDLYWSVTNVTWLKCCLPAFLNRYLKCCSN
jgi:hypothetical protein